MTARGGSWFVTSRGKQFYPYDPRPEDVDILDIAHALARTCRFGGHCREFYSVAQHSVLVSTLVPQHLALPGLMHDAAEAYVGDVISPIKRSLPFFDKLELNVMNAIRARYAIPPCNRANEQLVKEADEIALLMERRDLVASHNWAWEADARGYALPAAPIVPLAPKEAEAAFMNRWCELRTLLEMGAPA